MKFTFDGYAFTIDVRAYKLALERTLTAALKEAAAEWINATAVSLIPFWTGASLATFIKLARATDVNFSVSGPGVRYGFRNSEGSVDSDRENARYFFNYKTTMFHLVYNEYNDGNQNKQEARVFSRLLNPGPYNFQKAGEVAFVSYAAKVRLPDPFNSLRKRRRRV